MTDRIAAFVVVLDADVREDDPLAHAIRDSIRLLRGVADVRPVVADGELHIAEARADTRWRGRLLTLVNDPEGVDRLARDGRAR
jgi:hypothetical protein